MIILEEDLVNRVLDFDGTAAAAAASLAAERQEAGRRVDMRDTQVAGIALARHHARYPQRAAFRGFEGTGSRPLGSAAPVAFHADVETKAAVLVPVSTRRHRDVVGE